MNWRIAAATLAMALLPDAVAQNCERKEYAQYKEAAATAAGRVTLAFAHCRYGRAGVCADERAKISDALIAAKATNTLRFILADCSGEFDAMKR